MRALFFDMDGTLYDREAAFSQTFDVFFPGRDSALRHRACVCCDRRSVPALAAHAEGRLGLEEMHIERFGGGLRDAGFDIDDETALAFQHVYAGKQRDLRVSDRMRALIAHCRARFDRVGLMTNGVEAHQMAKIRRMGIDALFEPELILISGTLGVAKPAPGIYEIAARRVGAKPEEMTMVGDVYETDIEGALNAGWQAVYFNREKLPIPAGKPLSGHIVTTEAELDACIRQLAE